MEGVKVWGRRVGVGVQMIADESFSARFERTPVPPRPGNLSPADLPKMARERRGYAVRVIAKRCALRPRRRREAGEAAAFADMYLYARADEAGRARRGAEAVGERFEADLWREGWRDC